MERNKHVPFTWEARAMSKARRSRNYIAASRRTKEHHGMTERDAVNILLLMKP